MLGGVIMIIQHNIWAMNGNRMLKTTKKSLRKSTEKLSSGYRINRAADDAARLAISEKMREQIRGLDRGTQNILDGVSYIQIGEGAMGEMHSMVHRMRELAVQAANGILTDDDRGQIEQEIMQLKQQINLISRTTEFNTMNIFMDDIDISFLPTSIEVEGVPGDMNFFNATYDSDGKIVTYGGFIFNGKRVTWDKVDSDMVTTDAITGKQIFKEGTYKYSYNENGITQDFVFECKDRQEVPGTKRILNMTTSDSGVYIDGRTISWSDFVDGEGKRLSDVRKPGGVYTADFEGAKVKAVFDNGFRLNLFDTGEKERKYRWEAELLQENNVQAVDVDEDNLGKIHVTNAISNRFTENASASEYALCLRADDRGMWLSAKADDTEIDGSFQSWSQLGITSWDSGYDISESIEYRYNITNDMGEVQYILSYHLDDVTSLDSVIDGLEKMEIKGKRFLTSYETLVSGETKDAITFILGQGTTNVSFADEKKLGRDFNVQTVSDVGKGTAVYDVDNDLYEIKIDTDGSGTSDVLYDYKVDTSNISTAISSVASSIQNYMDTLENMEKLLFIEGIDIEEWQNNRKGDLTQLVGTDNITTQKYLAETITMNENMDKTNGGGSAWNPDMVYGQKYAGAHIDFSGLNQTGGYKLVDLYGLGFDSTCNTCSNHYSVVFTYGLENSVTSSSGYQYRIDTNGYNNYLFQIELASLEGKVQNGEDLCKAMIEIMTNSFDFHYTQYAADGATFYIMDNRTQYSDGATNASFDTKPFQSLSYTEVTFTASDTEHTGTNRITATYGYDFAEAAKAIKITAEEDAEGEYVKKLDGSAGYEKYNAETMESQDPLIPGPTRYNLVTTYQGKDSNGNYGTGDLTNISRGKAAETIAKSAVTQMIQQTSVSLNATDYTYVSMEGNENPNVAVEPEYETTGFFDLNLNYKEYKGIIIQCSGNSSDFVRIPRFHMGINVLGLKYGSCATQDEASEFIGMCDDATNLLSYARVVYGAFQNRLEHSVNRNEIDSENTQKAESGIRDTDVADEMTTFAKWNILQQAGQVMLAQANQSTQGVLALLG